MSTKTPYTILCKLNGKTISSAWCDCLDDNAAIERAHWYLSCSAADMVRVHEGPPFYPLGKVIAEITEAA